MKSRILNMPKETILIYGFDADKTEKFRACAKASRTELKILPDGCADEQVGYLAGFLGFSSSGITASRDEQCVIFSCIDGKKLNKVLAEMRSNELGNIPLKAAITAYNQKMTLSELIDELLKEHKLMHGENQV